MNLPTICNLHRPAPGSVLLDLDLPPTLEAFAGHFPGEPILPGVVQLDWAVRFAAEYLGLTTPVARDFKVKFSSIIRPSTPLSLRLDYDAAKRQLSFTYQCDGTTMASGVMRGMAAMA